MILMHNTNPGGETTHEDILTPPLPRRMLRHLIFSHRIDLGTRWLVAGCGEGELTRYLHMLGFEVIGIDDDLEKIETARKLSPHIRYEHWDRDHGPLNFAEQEFDLILVCGLNTFAHSIESRESLETTAMLLSSLKSSAPLVFINRQEYEQNEMSFGFPTCTFTNLLSNFPGPTQTALFPDGSFTPWPFNKLQHRGKENGYLAVSLLAPRPQLSRGSWLKLAENGVRKQSLLPFQTSQQKAESTEAIRRAA
ncbi:Methyltransferase domain protein [Polystyrenella longa]|uniref:Methyltransferase domain protein n=1 Tax=Polystyrenella longa TaxID=2528007 RepID=A0A518CHE0_9PLAN|nr:class I SAM-dependent methyltransferase [Polystyrenella longa]QDU78649.1 Methyltransferase domain protein [Polystyrenella longa]